MPYLMAGSGGPLESVLLRVKLRAPDGEAPLGLDQRDELQPVVVLVGGQNFPEGIWKHKVIHAPIFGPFSIASPT